MTGWLVPIGLGGAASLSTLLGGALALGLARRSSLLIAATAGVVLGVAFFDLLPESLELGNGSYSHRSLLACAALGFASYLLLSRALASMRDGPRWQVHLGPASLTLHSFLDGAAMGLAFAVAPEVGSLVALAVLTHDLADGVNTVSLALASRRRRVAIGWLVANGLAPLAGVIAGLAARLEATLLAPLMAAFGGVFLYVGACELVPRSLGQDGRMRTVFAVLAGVALMFVITTYAEQGG